MNLTSEETIKKLARQYKIHPSALLGQNFLIDEQILCSMIEAARMRPNDTVVEIGPGFGILTAELIKHAKKIIAVEKDKALARYLQTRFKDCSNLVVINEDILKFTPPEDPYRIIANIPYQITGKIIRKFMAEEINKPTDMLIMVQKEVGQRVCARPGKMNLLAICVQLYGRPSIIMPVPKQCFWPIPKVDSVLLSISNIKPSPLYKIGDLPGFWRVLKAGFSSPRKQLHNNLNSGLKIGGKIIKDALLALPISDKARAQELSLEQWIKLSEELAK